MEEYLKSCGLDRRPPTLAVRNGHPVMPGTGAETMGWASMTVPRPRETLERVIGLMDRQG